MEREKKKRKKKTHQTPYLLLNERQPPANTACLLGEHVRMSALKRINHSNDVNNVNGGKF
jgi:hypothetical protein